MSNIEEYSSEITKSASEHDDCAKKSDRRKSLSTRVVFPLQKIIRILNGKKLREKDNRELHIKIMNQYWNHLSVTSWYFGKKQRIIRRKVLLQYCNALFVTSYEIDGIESDRWHGQKRQFCFFFFFGSDIYCNILFCGDLYWSQEYFWFGSVGIEIPSKIRFRYLDDEEQFLSRWSLVNVSGRELVNHDKLSAFSHRSQLFLSKRSFSIDERSDHSELPFNFTEIQEEATHRYRYQECAHTHGSELSKSQSWLQRDFWRKRSLQTLHTIKQMLSVSTVGQLEGEVVAEEVVEVVAPCPTTLWWQALLILSVFSEMEAECSVET